MGGAVWVAGNVHGQKDHDESAEWNAFWDPPSAQTMLQLCRPPTRVVLCPLDATNAVLLTKDFIARLEAGTVGSPIGTLVSEMYAEQAITFGTHDVYAWDVLTLSFLLWPQLFESKVGYVEVVTEGISQGRTVWLGEAAKGEGAGEGVEEGTGMEEGGRACAEIIKVGGGDVYAGGEKRKTAGTLVTVLTRVQAKAWEDQLIHILAAAPGSVMAS